MLFRAFASPLFFTIAILLVSAALATWIWPAKAFAELD